MTPETKTPRTTTPEEKATRPDDDPPTEEKQGNATPETHRQFHDWAII